MGGTSCVWLGGHSVAWTAGKLHEIRAVCCGCVLEPRAFSVTAAPIVASFVRLINCIHGLRVTKACNTFAKYNAFIFRAIPCCAACSSLSGGRFGSVVRARFAQPPCEQRQVPFRVRGAYSLDETRRFDVILHSLICAFLASHAGAVTWFEKLAWLTGGQLAHRIFNHALIFIAIALRACITS